MSSPPREPSRLTTTLDSLAHRIHDTSGKEHLPIICAGGFLAETVWHSQAERHILKTSPALVRKALVRAALFWPGVYLVTSSALWWAERTVTRARLEKEGGRGEFR